VRRRGRERHQHVARRLVLEPTEQRAFDSLYAQGVLSIAAAGNDGNSRVSYPAGYDSVISVAAVDEAKNWATFSQYNKDVELAGPASTFCRRCRWEPAARRR
jgi:hypothetical protein